MERSFILNGQAFGNVANRLLQCNMDVKCLRPYYLKDAHGNIKFNKSFVTMIHNGKPVAVPIANTDTLLTKDEWIYLDTAITRVARQPLRAVDFLRSRGLVYTIPNGMGTTILQTQRMSDAGSANISMDGIVRGKNDRPTFDYVSLPLPIVSSDFQFTSREIAVSRNGGAPLDTTMAEQATRRVMEEVEKMTCGTSDFNGYTFGGGTIRGLCDTSLATSKTLTSPTDSDWTPEVLIGEILDMVQTLNNAKMVGPFVLWFDDLWGQYLEMDYKDYFPGTLMNRIKQCASIADVQIVHNLTDWHMVMFQPTSDIIRMVVGMELVTVQWPEQGGMLQNFKVMAIQVPQIRCDKDSNYGIVDGAPV